MTRLEASKRVVIAESLVAQCPTEDHIKAAKEARETYEQIIKEEKK